MKKRMISLILALCLCAGMLPLSALGASAGDESLKRMGEFGGNTVQFGTWGTRAIVDKLAGGESVELDFSGDLTKLVILKNDLTQSQMDGLRESSGALKIIFADSTATTTVSASQLYYFFDAMPDYAKLYISLEVGQFTGEDLEMEPEEIQDEGADALYQRVVDSFTKSSLTIADMASLFQATAKYTKQHGSETKGAQGQTGDSENPAAAYVEMTGIFRGMQKVDEIPAAGKVITVSFSAGTSYGNATMLETIWTVCTGEILATFANNRGMNISYRYGFNGGTSRTHESGCVLPPSGAAMTAAVLEPGIIQMDSTVVHAVTQDAADQEQTMEGFHGGLSLAIQRQGQTMGEALQDQKASFAQAGFGAVSG